VTFASVPAVDIRFLLAAAVVVVVCQAVGWAVTRIGQPAVCGEILAGILLGPSLLGLVWPAATGYLFAPEVVGHLQVLAQVGLILFMFLVGVELDLGQLRGQPHRAVAISHASIIIPLVLGGLLGWSLHPQFGEEVDRLGFALFMGAAMAITAFPVLARILQERGLTGTRLGVLVITCAAVDDVTAWCVLAVVVAVVTANGWFAAAGVLVLVGLFVAAAIVVVRPVLARLPSVPLWLAVALAFAAAYLTERIGVHAIFGAFLTGAILPAGSAVRLEARDKLGSVAGLVLLPFFFTVVGLSTRIDLLDRPALWALALLVTATAVAGKWGGCVLAARLVGESWRDASTIGILMNTRGLTELVILRVGLELGVINTTVFTVMVLMALATTFMATPLLRLSQRHDDSQSHHDRVAVA
jgi:Kef-type K+ transport system membrane component KefB